MLIFTRKKDQSIVIGSNVEVTVVEVRGGQVKLGVQAPAEVAVHRKEVFEAIQAENLRAAQAPAHDLVRLAAALKRKEGAQP
ncbi:carbon storage regulator CsrA [bacterium]|nr:carbon storage regulator CsrA [bacterium]